MLMNGSKAIITYLFHSGYAVETKQHFLIFDYYQPSKSAGGLSDGVIDGEYLKTKKNIYVFVSHSHADHFDPVILKWAKDNPQITYILSSDITINDQKLTSRVMSPYETFGEEGISVKTFGSTDEGLSFYVKTDEVSIFHAGDLNWWHWKGETKAEQNYAESMFKAEIERIKGYPIDIAFFPVDRRLEEFYAVGAEYFAQKLQPKLLLPMHFGDDFGASKEFSAKFKNASFAIAEITHRGQQIVF